MFGGINYKVIRTGTNFILVHGTKIEVSHWEVRISWSYRLRGAAARSMAVSLRGVAPVVIAQSE
jgi:hypothetical protein